MQAANTFRPTQVFEEGQALLLNAWLLLDVDQALSDPRCFAPNNSKQLALCVKGINAKTPRPIKRRC